MYCMQMKIQTRDDQLDTLAEIADILVIRHGQREMLQDVLGVLDRRLGMIRGTIMLLSPSGDKLLIGAVSHRNKADDLAIIYNWGEGITGRVVKTGEPAYVESISQEPHFRDRIHQRKQRNVEDVSFICVPVKLGAEVVGTLSVDIPLSESQYLHEHGRLLGIVSSLIAGDVQRRRTALEERMDLERENLRLRNALGENFRPENMIGSSKLMKDVYMRIHHVAKSTTTVLIRGESGTGKELVASAIHYASERCDKPFIKVNCAVLNEHLLESELFGHEKGAFTGAVASRTGRVEAAEGGTLFLDEIGEISPLMQTKLLRVLQEREYEKVGSSTTVRADVRIIAATNRYLEGMVSDDLFRQDLFYRINVFPIYMPPLRERKDDLLALANHFLDKCSKKLKKNIRRISTNAINSIMNYHWPGNIRELENCIEYSVLLASESVIHSYHLPPTLQMPDVKEINEAGTLKSRVLSLERDMIIDSLKHCGGSISSAAEELGITQRILRYKISKLNIDPHKLVPGKEQHQ